MHPEAANYLERIDDLRGQVSQLIAGLPAEALNWRPVEGEEDHATNSLAVLATHISGAERFWIHEAVGGHPAGRQRDQELVTVVKSDGPLQELLATTGETTRQTLAGLGAEDLDGTREVRDKQVPVRWAILHVIDHTALHLGHMQITYQLWNDGRGVRAPRWWERLR